VNRVIQGLKTFVDNPRHHDKGEKYAIGIVRNSKLEPEKPPKIDFVDDNPFLNRRLKNDAGTNATDISISGRDSL
ncbi:MAG: hypothetical protein Q8S24_00065, partial [Eubacteriales bacterium]|nr:hypothetical protein [Eubacteriales bacterium]